MTVNGLRGEDYFDKTALTPKMFLSYILTSRKFADFLPCDPEEGDFILTLLLM